MIFTVLIILAAVMLAMAAMNVPSGPINFGWLGMFFWCLTIVLGNVR